MTHIPFEINRDLKDYLDLFSSQLEKILGKKIKNVYLLGSIVLNDFRVQSDVDLLVITNQGLCNQDLINLKSLHKGLEKTEWGKRLEVSYITKSMLDLETMYGTKRPYYNSGNFIEAPYGHEWIIDKYILASQGYCLYGKPINLKEKVTRSDLIRTSIDFFHQDLEPLIKEINILETDYLIFLILSICRILFTINKGEITSKSKAVRWFNEAYPYGYNDLLNEAITWKQGDDFIRWYEAIHFIEDSTKLLKNTKLF